MGSPSELMAARYSYQPNRPSDGHPHEHGNRTDQRRRPSHTEFCRIARGSRPQWQKCERTGHNRRMIPADETFDGTFPFVARFSDARGFRMHYVDEGVGEPILLIHGEPTWSYLYRNFIPHLSRHHRVIAPDHMGFGKSETPADREYTLDEHSRNLGALIEELDLRDLTLVVQDWGGPIGAVLASRHPDRMKRFVVMNAVFGVDRNVREQRLTPWFSMIDDLERRGELEAVLGNLRYLVGGVMMNLGLERREVVTETWRRAYSTPFTTRDECRGAIAFPVEGLHLERIREVMKAALPKLSSSARPAFRR
jgi:haloalkane dehalogenase